MSWKINLAESSKKEKPVEDFINSLEMNTQSKVFRIIDLLKNYGNNLRMPFVRKVVGNIFELRIRGREEVRILFAFKTGNIIYLLHGFKKKSEKTPKKEIKIAKDRLDRI